MQEFEEEIREGSYELLFILSGNLTENETTPLVESVKKMLTSQSAQIKYEEAWGRKRLAYPIGGLFQGYYFLTQFTIPKENLNVINREIRLRPEILRYQIISIVLPTEGDREKLREARAKRLKEVSPELKEETKGIGEAKPAEEKKERKTIRRTKAKSETQEETPVANEMTSGAVASGEALSQRPVNLEELDKKLDALLEDDDMQTIL